MDFQSVGSNKMIGWWAKACIVFSAALLVLVATPFAANAQQYSGTITGTVIDPAGAAIVGAAVSATNTGTNASYSATTSEQGSYTFAQLPVGTYSVHVKQVGFKEFISNSVEVHTSTITEINAHLILGEPSEVVTVEASDVQVQTSTASIGEIVDGTQVRELPLNGENFMNLVTLSPGVSGANTFNGRDKGLGGGSDFSVNGNPYTNNLFLVDGVNNNDVGSNRTILVYPSVDAIAEFKLVRNAYGPEYGQASGAIISITTKSGENQFHGGAFYAGRNDVLNANDWLSNFNGSGKGKLRRNDWGYNASGPILKNKLFVFWNQEWNREIRGVSVGSCLPTAAEKAGDFSGFSGGVDQCNATIPTIPLALQAPGNPFKIANPDPAGELLASYYPDPNVSETSNKANNWVTQESQRPNWSEWNIRVDYDLTKKHRATFRWTQDSWTAPGPNPNLFWGDSFFPVINSDWSQPSKSVIAKVTSQLSSSMVNDVEFGYGHNAIITTLSGTGANGKSPAQLVAAINSAVPTAWPSSLKQSGALPEFFGTLGPYATGSGNLWNIAPYGNHEDLYAVQENLSKVHGDHLFKAGAYYSTNAKIEDNNGGTDQPTINPGGANVGTNTFNNLTNLLLPGQTFNTTENSINATAFVHWHDFEWYAQDTWKLRRNLTVEYGFRWSFYREPYGSDNHWASFSLANWSAAQAAANPSDACNGVIIVPGTDPCGAAAKQLAALGIPLALSSGTPGPNSALVNQNNHNIAPRLGISWDVRGDGKTAVRAGVGQFFQRELVGPDEGLARTAPFVIGATDVRTLETPAPLSSPSVSPSAAKDPRGVAPNSWQWNVSVERQLARDTALELGYIGNVGIHLSSVRDANAILPANWIDSAFASSNALNAFRQADNYGAITEFDRNGHSTYHSLQVLFRSRLGKVSNFQVSYTYSHSIGNVDLDNSSGGISAEAVTDPARPGLDRGNSNINRPHIFVANEVFYLPKLQNRGTLLRNSVGGWELNSIVNVQSGSSLSVFSNGAGDQFGSTLTSLTGTGYNPNNRALVTGINCNSGENGRQILNPAAFTVVGYAIGTIGDVPRGYCHGPNNRNFDAQLAKNWTFKEHYRVKFAIDSFNLFNHANFAGNTLEGTNFSAANVDCGASIGTAPVTGLPIYASCSPTNNTITAQKPGQNSTFGQATAVKPGREFQYSLKFTF